MKESGRIRVAVVEDDARIRRVLEEVIDDTEDCACVGAFRNGTSAVDGIPPLHPDVIVMDINLPDFSGVECVARLSPGLPDCRILMLTVYQDIETIFQALAAGAHGYLVKPVMPDKLIEAVREIRGGGVPMSPPIARKIIGAFLNPAPPPNPNEPPVPDIALGPREHQVLERLVGGLSQKEISAEIGVGISTVNTYIQRIYKKLHVRNRRGIIERYRSPPLK